MSSGERKEHNSEDLIFSMNFADDSVYKLHSNTIIGKAFIRQYGAIPSFYEEVKGQIGFIVGKYHENKAWPQEMDGIFLGDKDDSRFDHPDFYTEFWEQWFDEGREIEEGDIIKSPPNMSDIAKQVLSISLRSELMQMAIGKMAQKGEKVPKLMSPDNMLEELSRIPSQTEIYEENVRQSVKRGFAVLIIENHNLMISNSMQLHLLGEKWPSFMYEVNPVIKREEVEKYLDNLSKEYPKETKPRKSYSNSINKRLSDGIKSLTEDLDRIKTKQILSGKVVKKGMELDKEEITVDDLMDHAESKIRELYPELLGIPLCFVNSDELSEEPIRNISDLEFILKEKFETKLIDFVTENEPVIYV